MTSITSPTSLTVRIADAVVEMIRADDLQPGDALASSRELAKRFEVTTPTVREALRRLEATDVIRFRHGSGTYVGDGAGRRLLFNPHGRRGGAESVLELVEARLMIEPQVAAAAARSRTDEALAALEAAAANALEPQRGDERPALHFHVGIAAATGNHLVRETVEALLHVRAMDQVEIRHRYDDRERDHAEHRQILTAIRDRDADAAAALTTAHLQTIRDVVAGTLAEETGR